MRREQAAELPNLLFHLDEEAKLRGAAFEAPRPGDAGFDIRAAEDAIIAHGTQAAVSTGLRLAIPAGWVGIVKDRSSMASRRIYTHAGVIDAAYRGELKVLLSNQGTEEYQVKAGEKVAQMVIVPCLTICSPVASADALGATARGDGGFGSTGC